MRPTRIRDKKMKKLGFYLVTVALAISAAFTSCNKDKDNGAAGTSVVTTITATVEGAAAYNGKIDEVELIVDGYGVIKTVPYQNGGFTIDLTTVSVPESCMFNILLSNNPDAKVAEVYIFAGVKDGERVALFQYRKGFENGSLEGTYGSLFFSDSDLTFNHSESGESYSLNLKSGWNMIYSTYTTKSGLSNSTNAVSGLKWIVEAYWGD